MRRRRETRIVATAAAIAALAVPAAASGAAFDIAVTQTESADPVAPGTPVTYNATLTNEGTETFEGAGLDLFGLSPGGAKAVPANPYTSVSQSQGECEISPAGDYQQVLCDLGTLDPGESAQVTAVVDAHESMDHVAGLLLCGFGPQSCGAYSDNDPADDEVKDRLTVIVAPQVDGSNKLKLKGLPDGCVAGDVQVKAKAKGGNVKGIKAKLTGKNLRERLGSSSSGKLKFTIPGSQFEQARFYELNVNVTRKGAPGFKKSVELQAC